MENQAVEPTGEAISSEISKWREPVVPGARFNRFASSNFRFGSPRETVVAEF